MTMTTTILIFTSTKNKYVLETHSIFHNLTIINFMYKIPKLSKYFKETFYIIYLPYIKPYLLTLHKTMCDKHF